MKKVLAVLSLFLLSLIAAPVARVHGIGGPKGFAGTLWNATVVIAAAQSDKSIIPVCTGTVFQKVPGGYRVITAAHCLLASDPGSKLYVADDILVDTHEAKIIKARYDSEDFGGGEDMMVLEFKTSSTYPVIELGDESAERIGDETVNVNFTEMVAKQLTHGVISASHVMGFPGHYIVQEYGNSGASGSAVVDAKTHKIVGIVTNAFTKFGVGIAVEDISLYNKFMASPDQQDDIRSLGEDQ